MGGKKKRLSTYFWDVLILACLISRAFDFGQDTLFDRIITIGVGLSVIINWITYYQESKLSYINTTKKIIMQILNAFLIIWPLWNISNKVRNIHVELTPIILVCHIGVGLIIFMDVMYYLRLKKVK